MIALYIILAGLSLGSFVNALVWRLHQQGKAQRSKPKDQTKDQSLSIMHGRSVCVHCRKQLAVKDLIPVFSWLWLRGKCRYCKKSISWQYPLVELSTTAIFLVSYAFWPYEFIRSSDIATIAAQLAFVVWLLCLTGMMALLVYDIKWMLLPNKIIFPLYGLTIVYVSLIALQESSFQVFGEAALGSLIGGGLFYLLFQVSSGRWIGGGDVKLGFFIGALAGGVSQSLLMLFLASAIGTLFIIPLLVARVINRQTKIAFGPFLIVGCVISVLFSGPIIDWYVDILL